jgi:hypothetical protein
MLPDFSPRKACEGATEHRVGGTKQNRADRPATNRQQHSRLLWKIETPSNSHTEEL